jgi:phosphohistidine phosphatase
MSKVLTIVRHGKSDWDYDSLTDYDRPLKLRGYNDAYKMASRLRKAGNPPDQIFTSPANRALYTAIIFSRVLFDAFNRIQIKEEIYLGSYRTLLEEIKNCPDSCNHLAIFAHNPGVTNLANQFINDPVYNIPTSGYVRIEFKTDKWHDISRKYLSGYIFDYPKRTGI